MRRIFERGDTLRTVDRAAAMGDFPMSALSLPFVGRTLFDHAISRRRRDTTLESVARPRVRPIADPQPILVPGVADTIQVKLASRPEEFEQAFRLVAASYHERGYESTTAKPYRFTPHHALPDTTVFVAVQRERVVATFSLVADNSVLGLPLESLYPEEIGRLRGQGRRVGEITSLASTDLSQRAFLQVFMTMIRLLQQYHVHRGGDTWVITVNPRHSTFYRKVLGAELLGPCKTYAAVGDAPAEAYWVDRTLMRTNAPRGYEAIFGQALPPQAFLAPPLPRPWIRYFGSESTQTDEARLGCLLRTVATRESVRRW